jgi:hypothetical protein
VHPKQTHSARPSSECLGFDYVRLVQVRLGRQMTFAQQTAGYLHLSLRVGLGWIRLV